MKIKKCPQCGGGLTVTKQRLVHIYSFVLFERFKISIPYKVKKAKESFCFNCGYYEPKSNDKEINLIYDKIVKERINSNKKGIKADFECRYSEYCNKNCECCDIYKEEKAIADFEKAKNELINTINEKLYLIKNEIINFISYFQFRKR